MPEFRVTSAILCDEIRTENNNKLFLIGVYSGEVQVRQFPANLLLSVYIELDGLDVGDHHLELKVTSPNGEAGIQIEFVVVEQGPSSFHTPRLPAVCEGPGSITAELRVNGGSWMRVLHRNVKSPNDPVAARTPQKRKRKARF